MWELNLNQASPYVEWDAVGSGDLEILRVERSQGVFWQLKQDEKQCWEQRMKTANRKAKLGFISRIVNRTTGGTVNKRRTESADVTGQRLGKGPEWRDIRGISSGLSLCCATQQKSGLETTRRY